MSLSSSSTSFEKLEQARASIKSQCRRSDFSELMAFKCPPTKLIEMLSLVLILLETQPRKESLPNDQIYEWLEIVKRLNNSDLIDSITKMDTISKDTLDKAKIFINRHPDAFNENSLGKCSLSIAYLLVSWSLALINHVESTQN
ncbi:predicted protein [Naegleria gruberi]|uniref:Predicted protein n=1 Tax=Naegleria gruberi TaxID=5762 RepID=D2VND6_NAEGR|nr:uncharacterized protein NAEGRDRAFT_70458 [Naegleria gruberi]EFC41719.1 predicted protein [Naegleria gruberi]|eukprot:XP_002674463.1 predicted protein [Naegleria gruberi strain NEG-M]